jgi:DNA-binding transcriptional MerR regulator
MTIWKRKDVARYLGVSVKTIDRYCNEQLIPFSIQLKRKIFTKEEIDARLADPSRSFGSHSQSPRAL